MTVTPLPVEVTTLVDGEHIEVLERLVLANASGRFRPKQPDELADGQWIEQGHVIGFVEDRDQAEPVRAGWTGHFMGYLAMQRQRVSPSQPVAWLIAELPKTPRDRTVLEPSQDLRT
jgi:hypothetical protein